MIPDAVKASPVRITGPLAGRPPVEVPIDRPSFDLTVNMFGPIEIYRNPTEPSPEDAWRLSKSLHILCYIASRRNHRAPKDALVDLFWPDADADTIAKNFHPMISHVRKALNRDQVIKKDFIQYREGAYLLNPQYRYQIDTEEFERLLTGAREKRQSGDAEVAERMTAEAVSLYRGDFLEELYYDWAEELEPITAIFILKRSRACGLLWRAWRRRACRSDTPDNLQARPYRKTSTARDGGICKDG